MAANSSTHILHPVHLKLDQHLAGLEAVAATRSQSIEITNLTALSTAANALLNCTGTIPRLIQVSLLLPTGVYTVPNT